MGEGYEYDLSVTIAQTINFSGDNDGATWTAYGMAFNYGGGGGGASTLWAASVM
jgi:hypothetical protein